MKLTVNFLHPLSLMSFLRYRQLEMAGGKGRGRCTVGSAKIVHEFRVPSRDSQTFGTKPVPFSLAPMVGQSRSLLENNSHFTYNSDQNRRKYLEED